MVVMTMPIWRNLCLPQQAVHKLPESKIALTVETENVSSPAGNGDQSVEIKDLSLELRSSNELEKCKPKDYTPVINIFDEYDGFALKFRI